MVSYLLKVLALAVFSFIIIYFYYYQTGGIHLENFDGYLYYIVPVGIIYGIYKFFQFEKSEKTASFSLFKILGFFFLHLLVLSILLFVYNGESFSAGFTLFFKILGYLVLPVLIIFISTAFGYKITSYIKYTQDKSDIFKFLLSLVLGFFSFLYLLDVIGILGFYNLFTVFFILAVLLALSYKNALELLEKFRSFKIDFDIEEGSYFKLLSTEFLFLISTLVISVSLISIVRPFPIGWDDLGVYMNHPHLMAEAGSIIALGQMYAWQTFTGIGYMFGSPTQAFFLNNVGGILSFISLILIFTDLLKNTIKKQAKSFLNIPMIVATSFIFLPMVVFQQAKDMKLDPGLFFVSIIVVYLVFTYFLNKSKDSSIFLDNKGTLKSIVASFSFKGEGIQGGGIFIFFVIGILAGFAFSIKFTSLLLISSIIGLLFFVRLGLSGFLGYLSIYFAIFTKAGLWSMMNVVVNPNNITGFETKFFIVSFIVGVLFLAYSFYKNAFIIKKFFSELLVFLAGIILALTPWLGKNIVESYPNISVGTIISGNPERFILDKQTLYTEEELKEIEEKKLNQRMSEEGTSGNEDLGRYFGYETGINNYVKLPWNLTMQTNQKGEYTDIGFLFLALIPVLLLFLPFRNKFFPFFIVFALVLQLLVFIKTDNHLIDIEDIQKLSTSTQESVFIGNSSVFQNKSLNDDVYDIRIGNYIGSDDIMTLVNEQNSYDSIVKRVTDLFYDELKAKVLDHNYGPELKLIDTKLTDSDFEFIKNLRELSLSYASFNSKIDSRLALEKFISENNFDSEKEILLDIWDSNRSINQAITDFFSKYNLPFGYAFILAFFLLPLILVLYILDNKFDKNDFRVKLFKLNLVFATFYTFLWTISAFGIVWYGIVMYFSFLIIIAVCLTYLSFYDENSEEKEFLIKFFGSLVFALIFLIYVINSVLPHSFNNLKGAGYLAFKTGEGVNTINATYLYHREYLNILFHTNIKPEKREDFINEYVNDDIKQVVSNISKMDIDTIKGILTEVASKEGILQKSAYNSLQNIYKNISNPNDEFKNDQIIYRIGTFLRYHISENNKRLLEDSLLFNFNDYIYNESIEKTIENFKKSGVSYILSDLNAATIDKDSAHRLTTRYENLLRTFTSENLKLIDTDSICLKVALEDYKKSEKTSEDMKKYLTIAGVNHESYTDSGETIARGTKLLECYNRVDYLIENNMINENNYSYLRNLDLYVKQNKDLYSDTNELFKLLQQQITHGYKVFFEIK